MLEIRSLFAGYGKEDILRDLSLRIPKGSVTVLLGRNGCGKTTLLKTVAGLLPPRSGELLWMDRSLPSMKREERARLVSYLSQTRSLPSMTVEQLVLHGRFPHLSYPRIYRDIDRRAAGDAMERMEIAHLSQRPLEELSGGLRQKAYLAMALAQGGDLILLDEPTTFLDPDGQWRICHTLRTLAEEGKTVLAVLHDLPLALSIAHCAVLMEDGRAVFAGDPAALAKSALPQAVLGVRITSVPTPSGLRYYCEPTEKEASL